MKEQPRKAAIVSQLVVENPFFIALTTILTVYALSADDIRLIYTDKPADFWFNLGTGLCLGIFSIEVLLSCLGKQDYFPGFFFLLDLVSTATLVLDLTPVNDVLIQGDEENVDEMKGVETSAQLTRFSRVVRVLRLVRILKLYKAIHETKRFRRKGSGLPPGEEDAWWNEGLPMAPTKQNRESRVGKRLSDLTTRRTIILVLVMLLGLPFLNVDESLQMASSPTYGADDVNRNFRKMEADASRRSQYEQSLLRYIYYHNWFTGQVDGDAGQCPKGSNLCAGIFYGHVFWVGIVSRETGLLLEKARAAQLSPDVVQAWEKQVEQRNYVFNYGPLPPEALVTLSGRWDAACNARGGDVQRLGLSLLQEKLPARDLEDIDGFDSWGRVDYAVKCPEDLRRIEQVKYKPTLLSSEEAKQWHLAFYFDVRQLVRTEAWLALITMLFVCMVLCAASLAFASDANKLVLHPVENMISKVEAIRDDPLRALKMADDEFKAEEMNKIGMKRSRRSKFVHYRDTLRCRGGRHRQAAEPMETVVLEKTIIKLGSLLALGFGEAGANIIGHNMVGADSACVDAMVDGTRMQCVIGCTRIRDFGIATEVLQNKVMMFVNEIAEVVHGVVDEFHGAANKNNGDLFLLIWRMADFDEGESGGVVKEPSKIVDMSMYAFTKILGAVHRSPVLAAYRYHPGLQQRLKAKNCRVNLSFGLHQGWAIEGAVGSEFKIDASYLSPNVSIAETVERATDIYGVSLLLTESVVMMCSPSMAVHCRRIDRVIMPGSPEPLEMYCIDLDYMSLTVEPEQPNTIVWSAKNRYRIRQFLESEKNAKWSKSFQVATLFNDSPDVAAMRFRYTEEFKHVFNMGYQNYSQGEWSVAQKYLSSTRIMLGVLDGPSCALLRFMEGHEYKSPLHWRGTRHLHTS